MPWLKKLVCNVGKTIITASDLALRCLVCVFECCKGGLLSISGWTHFMFTNNPFNLSINVFILL